MSDSSQRLDVWLDIACLFKTRSQASTACRAGKVDVDGRRAKPNRQINRGDEISITRSRRAQIVVVKELREHSVPKAEARNLYDDTTPPPTAAELEVMRIERDARLFSTPAPKPGKRDRRALRRLKGR